MTERDYAAEAREARRRRLEIAADTDRRVLASVAALGCEVGSRYDLLVRWEQHRGTRLIERQRLERAMRWSGRTSAGMAEFYTPRPIPHGGEVSRYLEVADILEVRPSSVPEVGYGRPAVAGE